MANENSSANATILVKNRESAALCGVEDVVAFDDREIICRTILGELVIEGSSLHITEFCAQKGELSVLGKISSLVDEDKKEKERARLSRLFGK